MKRKMISSLQLKTYIKCKKLKLNTPEVIRNEIEYAAACKIQKAYKKHLNFIKICENIQNIPVTKKTLRKMIFYGLHLDNKKNYKKIDYFQGLFELRYIFTKLLKNFLSERPCNSTLGITENQLKEILKILNKDQLLTIGYGLDKYRIGH